MTAVMAAGPARCRLGALPALLIVLVVAVAGCAAPVTSAGELGDRPLRVVATTNFVADTARQVGGDRVLVTGLMGAGVDPHLYRAQPSDVETLQQADVIVHNGLELEGKLAEILTELGETRPVVAVSETIPEQQLLPAGSGQTGEFDPHTWFDPARWEYAARAMADAFAQTDPTHADHYQRRFEEFRAELAALDRYAADRLAAVAPRSRVLVTSHDAFGYFADAYDFDVAAIQGISTQAEATTADIERVARTIAERDLRTVFVESSVSRQTIEAVLATAAQRGQRARIGGQLYGDNAGDRGTPEGTYAGALRHNIDLIAAGLR